MPVIYVDADACPVKAETEQVATRHHCQMILVSNGGIRPSANPLVKLVIVDTGLMKPTNISLPMPHWVTL